MDFSDWRLILAVLAIIIGFLRLFFPDQFKQIGNRIWSLEKSQNVSDMVNDINLSSSTHVKKPEQKLNSLP